MSSISELVCQYRELKTKRDEIEAAMQALKANLEPLVKDQGNWQDAEGYARITITQPSTSFDAKAVNNLVNAWLSSDDAVMKSCGDTLMQFRHKKHGSTYLSVK